MACGYSWILGGRIMKWILLLLIPFSIYSQELVPAPNFGTDVYGYLFLRDATFVLSTTNANFVTVDSLDMGDSYGCTLSDSSITVRKTGVYLIAFNSSFSGAATVTIDGNIFINTTSVSGFDRKMGATGDVGAASCSYIGTLTSGDIIKAKFTNKSTDAAITINNINLKVMRIK